MERSIPHVRDIFGVAYNSHHHNSNHLYHHQHHAPPRLPIYQTLVEKELPSKLKDMSLQHHSHHSSHHKHHKQPGSDSAVSVGSSDDEGGGGDDNDAAKRQRRRKKNGKDRPSRRDSSDASQIQSRTLRARDVQHLERHLSMKKTIRKKIMRDLQQAFVEDPSDFRMDPRRISPERKKAVNIQNLVLSPPAKGEPTFLDMLRDNDDDSGNGSPTREKQLPTGPAASAPGRTPSPTLAEDTRRDSKVKAQPDSGGSSSFWKRFTMKKSKR